MDLFIFTPSWSRYLLCVMSLFRAEGCPSGCPDETDSWTCEEAVFFPWIVIQPKQWGIIRNGCFLSHSRMLLCLMMHVSCRMISPKLLCTYDNLHTHVDYLSVVLPTSPCNDYFVTSDGTQLKTSAWFRSVFSISPLQGSVWSLNGWVRKLDCSFHTVNSS